MRIDEIVEIYKHSPKHIRNQMKKVSNKDDYKIYGKKSIKESDLFEQKLYKRKIDSIKGK